MPGALQAAIRTPLSSEQPFQQFLRAYEKMCGGATITRRVYLVRAPFREHELEVGVQGAANRRGDSVAPSRTVRLDEASAHAV